MVISKEVQKIVKRKPEGVVITYADFSNLGNQSSVVLALSKLFKAGVLEKHKRVVGNLTVKYKKSKVPFESKDIEQLQIIDALRNIKKIPDARVNKSVSLIKKRLEGYSEKQVKGIYIPAKKSQPRGRALVGAISKGPGNNNISGKA